MVNCILQSDGRRDPGVGIIAASRKCGMRVSECGVFRMEEADWRTENREPQAHRQAPPRSAVVSPGTRLCACAFVICRLLLVRSAGPLYLQTQDTLYSMNEPLFALDGKSPDADSPSDATASAE